ncbi:MAG TPA: OmpA family protein [Magnetovibrio sp.]
MLKTLQAAATAVALTVTLGACATSVEAPATQTLNAQESQAYEAAIGHFTKLMAEKPGEIEAVLGLTRNLRWAGRTNEAAAVLQANQSRFGGDGRYIAELGKVRLIQGDSIQGVRLLDEAATQVGNDWRLYSALGIGLDYQQNYSKAEAAYRKALDMCPDDAAVMNNLGISQGLSGRLDRAILTLQDALELQGHTAKIERNLKLFKDARDLCASCGAKYLKNSGSMILAAGLKDTDKEGPCTPQPAYTQQTNEMVEKLVEAPSINIKVYFEFDSAILKPEAMDVLDNLGTALTSGELSAQRFELAGHTDAVGSEAYNLDLSERRAKSVRDYLVTAFGIEPARIDAVGYGESHLLDTENPEGDVNRRVQVTRLGPVQP